MTPPDASGILARAAVLAKLGPPATVALAAERAGAQPHRSPALPSPGCHTDTHLTRVKSSEKHRHVPVGRDENSRQYQTTCPQNQICHDRYGDESNLTVSRAT
ncbi:hypothetical protein AAFF_G00049550 [Aldrovandia affinis]|uniref:Uncharacterized protein n=1 Tax=Aldrovandia affinis TaxID=143900 RepID=A0AAD7S1C2_9TELE|nr:hypothetical protein AAFF_G00049550 [Aldrovandia affinis]